MGAALGTDQAEALGDPPPSAADAPARPLSDGASAFADLAKRRPMAVKTAKAAAARPGERGCRVMAVAGSRHD
jgi:hypothetical protein